jgi:hypothetical protein
MFERWHWTLENVESMEFEDFILLADAVADLNRRDIEARKAMTRGR